jgi:hypothetical protein
MSTTIPKPLNQSAYRTSKATESASLLAPIGRRQAMGAGVGAAAAAATLLQVSTAQATGRGLADYFDILATGEALFVTFYENAVTHHSDLGLHGSVLDSIAAILVEEQIHLNFAMQNGGRPATTHFSFPKGQDTFRRADIFWQTQQLAEELTNGALLAWINDMARMHQPRLAQVGGQLMQVEGGHRVVGRAAVDAHPWDNWAFGPVAAELNSFLDVPNVVTKHGFLSPKPGNDFTFHAVTSNYPGVINTSPDAKTS